MAWLFWLELKAIFRRPIWVLLVVFSVWISYTLGDFAPRIHIGLEMPLAGPPRGLFSIGELGRAILLTLEMFGGLFLSLLTALIAIGSLAPEFAHREVLWTSCNGTRLRLVFTKLVAVSSFVVCLLVLGSCTSFFNPSVREVMSLAGWQYVPLYLALAWIRISLWGALAILLFSLTRSRWAATFVVFALHMAWFGTAGIWWEPSLPRLLQRNFIAWNFVSAFTPFGIIPVAFFFQGLMVAGIALALLGSALWTRKRLPEWVGLKFFTERLVVSSGVILALGAGWGITRAIQVRTAPFTAAELWDGKATLNRPFVWSQDYRLLVYPGKYMAVRLPPNTSIPGWVKQLAMEGELRRYDNVGEIILASHFEPHASGTRFIGGLQRVASASLILVYHSPNPYPLELEKAISRYWQAVLPLLDQARPWVGTVQKVVIWPEDVFEGSLPTLSTTGEFRIGYAYLCESIKTIQWFAAGAISYALSPNKLVSTYFEIYLMSSVDRKEAEKALDWLRNRAEGGTPKLLRGIGLHPYSWKPEEAAQVVQHWQRGEELGHENYLKVLLQGGGDD